MPSLGKENAKLVSVPAGLVRSMEAPKTVRPCAELPNPTNAGSPARPPAMDVRVIGSPDASGIIAPLPVAPVAPVAPVEPVN